MTDASFRSLRAERGCFSAAADAPACTRVRRILVHEPKVDKDHSQHEHTALTNVAPADECRAAVLTTPSYRDPAAAP